MLPVNAFMQIRDFFGSHPDLAAFSTQKGFGELLGRSDAFVRRLEKGSSPITPRVAKLVETITGVDQQWVMSPGNRPILAKGGKEYSHEIALLAVERQVQTVLQKVGVSGNTSNDQLRRLVIEQLDTALEEEEKIGSCDLLQELVKILRTSRNSFGSARDKFHGISDL